MPIPEGTLPSLLNGSFGKIFRVSREHQIPTPPVPPFPPKASES